jgi:SAM-dependent methyltransferase
VRVHAVKRVDTSVAVPISVEVPAAVVESGLVTIRLRAPFEDLTFMTPLSERRADALVGFLADGLDGTVLDLGCGWAELLLRVTAARPNATGVGVDTDELSIEHGRDLARRRGLTHRVELLAGDARHVGPEHADAVICIGASQIWGPPVADNQPLDYASALSAIRAKVSSGARVLYGEGVWSQRPTPQAIQPLSGRADEFVSLAELLEITAAHGFLPVTVHEADLNEWDEFESGYSACYAKWLVEHGSDHPDASEVRERAARQRAAYYGGYRGVLGMAYLGLLAV